MRGPRPPGRPALHLLALAHHPPDQAQRCVTLPLGRRGVALCARCLGLYPALGAGRAQAARSRAAGGGRTDWWRAQLGTAPALGVGQWHHVATAGGSNPRRVVSGALLGLGLARAAWLYFADALHGLLYCQGLLVLFTALAFGVVRRARRYTRGPL